MDVPLSSLPPSFYETPLAYGLALFGDVLATALSAAVLCRYFLYVRRSKQAVEGRDPLTTYPSIFHTLTLADTYKNILIGFLWMVLLRSAPDALIMLLWGGHTSVETMRHLFQLDYCLDFVALVPLGIAITLWFWSRQSMEQHLVSATPLGRMNWPTMTELFKILGLVTVIAAGVTIAKAAA